MKNKIRAVILAAGKGTRMKSNMLKVIHQVQGQPMLKFVMDAVSKPSLEKIYIVVGHQSEAVRKNFKGKNITFVGQKELLGTGHAVMQVIPHIKKFAGSLLVLNGDIPLITSKTLKDFLGTHVESNAAATVLTAQLQDPAGYGRIVRGIHGSITKIVEQKDAGEDELRIKEVNTGIYCFKAQPLIKALRRIKPSNVQKEYYLTDVIEILKSGGQPVLAFLTRDASETMGINTRQDIAKAEKILQKRVAMKLMDSGVTIIDPDSTFIDPTVTIGQDTVVYPFTFIKGDSSIGTRCDVGPHSQLNSAKVGNRVNIRNSEIINSTIGDDAKVRHSVIRNSTVEKKRVVGPFEKIGEYKKQ